MGDASAATATATANRALSALADLAPSAEDRASNLVVPTEWFRWLPLSGVRLFVPPLDGDVPEAFRRYSGADQRGVPIERKYGEALAAVDRIRPNQRSLRVGWLFVAGRLPGENGQSRRVFHPLVTVPVAVSRLTGTKLLPAGDADVSELIADRATHLEVELSVSLGGGGLDDVDDVAIPTALLVRMPGLQHFARTAAEAAGLPATLIVPAQEGPDQLMRHDGLRIVVGIGVYAVHTTGSATRAGSLRTWAQRPLDELTAFHRLYVDGLPDPPPAAAAADAAGAAVESPFLLSPAQADAVRRSRHEPVTLISGAPGTGKSHTIAAIACDALARDETVLVAAKSDATVDALLDLLERSPGPNPVVFGSNERREALAARLSAGQLQAESAAAIAEGAADLRAAREQRDERWAALADRLRAEMRLDTPEDEVDEGRRHAPLLFDPATDLGEAARLLDAARTTARGWWARRRRREAERRLRALAGATADPDLTTLAATLAVARAARQQRDLLAAGGLEIGARAWARLLDADDRARAARGRWLAAESRSERRLNRQTLPAVAALATALRSGRAARREQLGLLNDERLTRALPLWVGTLSDVDDLLPAVPALFDLVILDEASSIDQVLAAPALLRGARAVVAGDPHQLRHVSFLADDQLRIVLAQHDLDAGSTLAARLDVRRNSLFDVAAGAAPTVVLGEHFRSDPHLVEFVARRLYGGHLQIASRSPDTECRGCVEVIRLQGRRDEAGVVRNEVHKTISLLRGLLEEGTSSVGVVTPFRAQADALEAAVLQAVTVDELDDLDLRVGTVHAFQGNERDVVIASIGLGEDDGATSWRFVEDPHLFAVFMTRARKRLIVLASADPPEGGLVAAYLAQAHSPPGRPRPAAPPTPWAAAIAADLTAAGIEATTAYPSGRHLVDVCLRDATRNVGVECGVHPDGPDAHIQRHLDLLRRRWDLREAYRSRWQDCRAELVVSLVRDLS